MWRWLKRIGVGLIGLVVLLLLVGAAYEQYMRWQAARRYPPMGKLVDVGGRHIQIDCRGSGPPTVVFEAGGDNLGSLAWAAVHDSVAVTTRACAYSRAGMLWSDPNNGPFDPRGVAKDLHTALAAAGEHPPFVMVGHSLGGPYIMIFTSMYPADVAGLVFVDASHPDQVDRMRKALGQNPGGAQSQFLVKMLSAFSWTGIARVLPLDPPGPATTKAIAAAYVGTSLAPLVREAIGIESTLQVAGRFRDLGSRPLVVLTGTKPHSPAVLKAAGLKPDQDQLFLHVWEGLHDDEATWSRRSRHQLVPDATHYIQFDRPDVVIAAVREVSLTVRQAGVTASAK